MEITSERFYEKCNNVVASFLTLKHPAVDIIHIFVKESILRSLINLS